MPRALARSWLPPLAVEALVWVPPAVGRRRVRGRRSLRRRSPSPSAATSSLPKSTLGEDIFDKTCVRRAGRHPGARPGAAGRRDVLPRLCVRRPVQAVQLSRAALMSGFLFSLAHGPADDADPVHARRHAVRHRLRLHRLALDDDSRPLHLQPHQLHRHAREPLARRQSLALRATSYGRMHYAAATRVMPCCRRMALRVSCRPIIRRRAQFTSRCLPAMGGTRSKATTIASRRKAARCRRSRPYAFLAGLFGLLHAGLP